MSKSENKLVTKEAAEEADTRAEQAPAGTAENDGVLIESQGEWAPNESTEATDLAEITARNGGTLSQEDIDKMPEDDQRQIRPT